MTLLLLPIHGHVGGGFFRDSVLARGRHDSRGDTARQREQHVALRSGGGGRMGVYEGACEEIAR